MIFAGLTCPPRLSAKTRKRFAGNECVKCMSQQHDIHVGRLLAFDGPLQGDGEDEGCVDDEENDESDNEVPSICTRRSQGRSVSPRTCPGQKSSWSVGTLEQKFSLVPFCGQRKVPLYGSEAEKRDDGEESESDLLIVSPFGQETFQSAKACWQHAADVHGFSLVPQYTSQPHLRYSPLLLGLRFPRLLLHKKSSC
eukprot:1682308-Amphidinium_carterae.2